jgi:hypothetical protein
MWEMLDRLESIAIPRIRDFRGLNPRSFDGRGNYSLGIREQIIFPEIDYDAIDQVRGLDVAITTSAHTDEEGFELLRMLGMPFRQPDGERPATAAPAPADAAGDGAGAAVEEAQPAQDEGEPSAEGPEPSELEAPAQDDAQAEAEVESAQVMASEQADAEDSADEAPPPADGPSDPSDSQPEQQQD